MTTGFDALAEHFRRPDRRETPEQIAHNAIAVLLALPVAERMEAMGMERVGVWAEGMRVRSEPDPEGVFWREPHE